MQFKFYWRNSEENFKISHYLYVIDWIVIMNRLQKDLIVRKLTNEIISMISIEKVSKTLGVQWLN